MWLTHRRRINIVYVHLRKCFHLLFNLCGSHLNIVEHFITWNPRRQPPFTAIGKTGRSTLLGSLKPFKPFVPLVVRQVFLCCIASFKLHSRRKRFVPRQPAQMFRLQCYLKVWTDVLRLQTRCRLCSIWYCFSIFAAPLPPLRSRFVISLWKKMR